MTPTLLARPPVSGLIRPASAHGRAAPSSKPTIVLVHGAFADGSSWQRVIPPLERDGYGVIAVQLPLSSLTADVETTKRVIAAQTGPVVVVGHSYAGAVITQAAAGCANVAALVYISAFAPDSGEAIGALGHEYPAPLDTALKRDAAGFLFVDAAKFHQVLAADLPAQEAAVLWATQKPIVGSVFAACVDKVAWKSLPSWYIVTQDDSALNPNLQRFYAKRMHAQVTEIKSSHASVLSHAADVVRVIEQAAGGS